MESKIDLTQLYSDKGFVEISPLHFEIDSFVCKRTKHPGKKDTRTIEIVFVSHAGEAIKMVFHSVTIDLWDILTHRMTFKIINLKYHQYESAKPIGVVAVADDGDKWRLFSASAVGVDEGEDQR